MKKTILPVLAVMACASATYVIDDDSFGEGSEKVEMKVLRNVDTGEKVEVVPALGGKTEALILRTPRNKLREVLLDHGRNATAVHANVGWKGAMLIPYANRIDNGTYSLNGKTHYLERNEDRTPYGKIALHGYLYRKRMTVVNSKTDAQSALLTLGYDFDGSDPGYPFLLAVNVTYMLSRRGFTVTTTVRNTMKEQPLPFFNSWHSYFKVADISKATLTLDRCSAWNHIRVPGDSNVNSSLIPTGLTAPWTKFDGKNPIGGTKAVPTYYDDEFKAVASVDACPVLRTRVHDGVSGDTAVLWQDSRFRFVQVFSGTMHNFGESAIAIEAMSSEADAWNNKQGINVLQAGETFIGRFGVAVE